MNIIKCIYVESFCMYVPLAFVHGCIKREWTLLINISMMKINSEYMCDIYIVTSGLYTYLRSVDFAWVLPPYFSVVVNNPCRAAIDW